MASYYCRFIPSFAKIATLLYARTKKDAPFKWTPQCDDAFNHLKSLLAKAPVLSYLRFGDGQEFILETDASTLGLGAILSQKQKDGSIHPITYSSRQLQRSEKNYGITELETLAIVWSLKHFRPYLYGHHCVLYTDHSACTSLLNSAKPSAKLVRWAMIVQELDVEIRYRPGKRNANADALQSWICPASQMCHR